MLDIIDLAFELNRARLKPHQTNVAIELGHIRQDIEAKIIQAKDSQLFMKEVIDMYDVDKLMELAEIIKKEVAKRNIKALNNEL